MTTHRTPYLEIALTIAVLAFVAFVIAGAFNRPPDDVAQATIHHK
jgi:multisubunit Na+/H+ antiporter MnhF subunit